MKYQGKAYRQFGGEKQRIAVQRKPDMAVGPKFGEQQILDVAPSAVEPCDQIVGRRQRPHPVVDAGPDLRLIMQYLMEHRMDRR